MLVNSDCSVRLIDFGSASSPGIPTDKKWDASLAATPFFASPQVLGGEGADPRDDVFSLACLSYAVFSRGGRPFGDKTTLDAYRDNMRPPLLTDIPPRLFAVIARGLAMERERRPATVHEFLDQLTGSATHACATAGQIFVQQPALPRSQTESTAVQSTVPVATRFTRNGVVPFAHQSKIIPSQPLLLRMDSCVAGEYPVGFTFAVRSKSALSVNGLTAQGRSATRNNPQVPQRYPHPARRSYVLGLTAMVLGMVSLVLRTVQPSAPRPTNAAHSLPTTALPVLVSPAAVNPPSSKVVQTAARKSGFIGFETSAVSAVSAQPLVALQVRRLESTRGSAAIAWQVVGGTAQPNVDYVREAPHVIRFIEGQAVRSIYISLVAHSITTAPRGPRSFAVTLVPVAGSPAIGPYSSVTVTIRPLPPAIDRSAAGESSTLARAALQ